uniref:Reverse transcriptase domain-containing protein n=1 Tax=Tanacetum cinerariifolium TaxID=118510 RepID=A0A6L2MV50_TANCI|nr:reverse transcriptase domain-containing protein [Tanacetum cinerariifolium]
MRRNKRRTPNVVEPELHTIVEMADNRTMEELLQAPTEGFGEAIVISEINADHFEIKTNLLQLVQANPYHGFKKENPHTHINNFKRITLTLKFRDVPNDFDISFADALLLMPKFASTIKSFLTNKDKLFELAKIPLNENCLVMLLKKLPEKLGDPGKFLIPSDFSRMDVCHALADLVVDFEADARVTLILGRSFLRTDRALIDVYGDEITLRVNDEAVTFNLNQTTRYSSTYDDFSVNQIDIIDVAREEYAHEILGFSNNSLGVNPTLTFKPILFYSSLSLTLLEGSDFILEEIDAYLKDELISPEINHADCDLKGDI